MLVRYDESIVYTDLLISLRTLPTVPIMNWAYALYASGNNKRQSLFCVIYFFSGHVERDTFLLRVSFQAV